jgi:hypothetical protein
MARILIGSSNIRRFYPNAGTKTYPVYKLEVTTLRRAFEVTLDNVPNDSKVVISVLENLIKKELALAAEEEKQAAVRSLIEGFITSVVEKAKKNKGARFALAYPILRPGNEWMTKYDDFIRDEFETAYNKHSEINISKVDAVSRGSQVFERDGVHLTKAAGNAFVANLIGMAEDCFDAPQIQIDDDEEEESSIDKLLRAGQESSKARKNSDLSDLKKVTHDLKGWKATLETSLHTRFMADNLMFARLRDEMDSETNRKREDRTLVTYLIDPETLPKQTTERNEALRKEAKEFCIKIKEDFVGEVMFATTTGRSERGNLMLEFRLDSVEKAREIRKAFAISRSTNKLPAEMEKIQMSTVITLATKVRIEIMKAMARKIESQRETAYVPTFLPRPILHIKVKVPGGKGLHLNSLTFAEAIQQYGEKLNQDDLVSAYRKAGGNFKGQMRQHFVVLAENVQIDRSRFTRPPPPPPTRGNKSGKGKGTKRGSDHLGEGTSSSSSSKRKQSENEEEDEM